ncbi:MAG: hypothetical protein ABH883_02140 [Candidatus Omnitrophota bacterium]
MRKINILFLLCFSCFLFSAFFSAAENEKELFMSTAERDMFADDISYVIEKAWKKWQDSVVIGGIDVQGSRGILRPGSISEPVLTAAAIMSHLDRKDKSQSYIKCVKAAADAVENGMRLWQRGYTHDNIPFPQGASCSYTLPPCNNVPVSVSSGESSGDKAMTEENLYNYMIYRAPVDNKNILLAFRCASKAIAECFKKWEASCSIVGILASGGIAPSPAPMGNGPGAVKGAKGNGGKLIGAYFSGGAMRDRMKEYLTRKTEPREF